jgi:hypothetical protein
MTTTTSNLGAAKNRMDIQSEFVANLRDSIEKGVVTLVDAGMTEESTRLKVLQTQQQLGVQACRSLIPPRNRFCPCSGKIAGNHFEWSRSGRKAGPT